MNRLKDLRTSIKSLEGAKTAFGVLAQLEISLAKSDAQFEAKISRLKERHLQDTQYDMTRHQNAAEDLCAYIEMHPEEFKEPRKVKTEWGSFGLQTATEVLIGNEEQFKLAARDGFADCVKTVLTPVKTAIKAHFEAGEKVPGCVINTGDTAVYSVKKVLLDEAKHVEES